MSISGGVGEQKVSRSSQYRSLLSKPLKVDWMGEQSDWSRVGLVVVLVWDDVNHVDKGLHLMIMLPCFNCVVGSIPTLDLSLTTLRTWRMWPWDKPRKVATEFQLVLVIVLGCHELHIWSWFYFWYLVVALWLASSSKAWGRCRSEWIYAYLAALTKGFVLFINWTFIMFFIAYYVPGNFQSIHFLLKCTHSTSSTTIVNSLLPMSNCT